MTMKHNYFLKQNEIHVWAAVENAYKVQVAKMCVFVTAADPGAQGGEAAAAALAFDLLFFCLWCI